MYYDYEYIYVRARIHEETKVALNIEKWRKNRY